MIFELMRLVEKEIGQQLPRESAHRLEAALCHQFGGERVYVPKLPKLVAQVRVASLGTGMATAALASEMHMSVRQVRRIVRGK